MLADEHVAEPVLELGPALARGVEPAVSRSVLLELPLVTAVKPHQAQHEAVEHFQIE